jgi:hypothetical protein
MEMLGCYYTRTPRVVSIVPDARQQTRGHVASRGLARGTVLGVEAMGDIRAERRVRDLIMVSLAGGVAARMKTGRATGLGSATDPGSDRDNQADLILRLAPDVQDQKAWWTLLGNETRRALKRHWPAVEALAQALLERKRIPGREARVIAEEASERLTGGEQHVRDALRRKAEELKRKGALESLPERVARTAMARAHARDGSLDDGRLRQIARAALQAEADRLQRQADMLRNARL